jgi:hypothetical protein
VNGIGRAAFAAAVIRECRRVLVASGSTLAREAVGKSGKAGDWRHYPAGDVYDPSSHAQYFYHHHPAAEGAPDEGEHGHFHLFLRAEGMPRGVTPLLLPEAGRAVEAWRARRSQPSGRDRARPRRRSGTPVHDQSLGHRRNLVSRRRRGPHG